MALFLFKGRTAIFAHRACPDPGGGVIGAFWYGAKNVKEVIDSRKCCLYNKYRVENSEYGCD